MTFKLKRISSLLFLTGILLILFFILEGLLSNKKWKLFISYQDVIFILVICCFVGLSLIVNLEYSGYIVGDKGNGIGFMLPAAISLCSFFIFSLYYKHMLLVIGPPLLCKVVKFSFVLTFTYVLLEVVFYVLPVRIIDISVMTFLESIFHDRQRVLLMEDMRRVRGFAFEPSYFVPVLFFMLPFILNNRSLVLAWCLTVILTFSPTAYLASLAFWFMYKAPKTLNIMVIFIVSVFICLFLYFISVEVIVIPWNLLSSSTIRIGSWVSSLSMIYNNIFFGVGPGMSGYWVHMYYPEFFYSSWEANNWISLGKNEFSAPTFASILTLISVIGVLPVFYTVLYMVLKSSKKKVNNNRLGTASIVAMLISSFGVNDYSFAGFWIFFAITMSANWYCYDIKK